MLKKIVFYTIIAYLVIVIIGYKYKQEYPSLAHQSLQISSWNYDLNEIDSEKVKFSYGITLSNDSGSIFFVRTIRPNYKVEVENNLEYDNVIIVSKEIKPKEKLDVRWDIIIKNENITEININELKSLLTSIQVSSRLSTNVGTNVISGDSVATFYQ